jgi:hypothetical protein
MGTITKMLYKIMTNFSRTTHKYFNSLVAEHAGMKKQCFHLQNVFMGETFMN